MTLEELRESEAIQLVIDGKYKPKDLDNTLRNLRNRVKELEYQQQLDRAEIIRLRRWIERLEERDD